ncbi:MAG: efflux RND transporter periplasmic adaptor subunit [Fimbriiglobus sp.]
MKRLVVGLIVVAAAGAGVVALNGNPLAPPPAVAPVTSGPPPGVSALGRIRPRGDLVEIGADASRRLAHLAVAEGDAVKAGDELGHLDSRDELAASLAYAEAQLVAGKVAQASKVVSARADLAKAELDLRSVVELNPKTIQSQELTVAQRAADTVYAKQEQARAERTAADRSGSRENLEAKVADAASKAAALTAAEAELARLRAALPIDTAKAKQGVTAAKEALEAAETGGDTGPLAKNVELARTRLAAATLRAPMAGVVVRLRTRPGETINSAGVLTLADTSVMEVVAEVYETDLHRIREGQAAKITSAALPTPLTGTVSVVGRLINKQTVYDLDPAAATDARVAAVRVRLDSTDPAARLLNLQVTVTIDAPPPAAAPAPPAKTPPTRGRP